MHQQGGVLSIDASDKGLVHDHDRQPRGGHVLLRAGVDEAEARKLDRPREDVRGHVAHQRAGRLRVIVPLGAVDRVVGAVIKVFRVRRKGKLVLLRDAVVPGGRGVGSDAHRAVLLRLLGRAGGKAPRDGVVGRARGEQVHPDRGELQRRAALQQQDLVALGHVQELPERGLGRVEDLPEGGGTVAHLHDGHARAAIVQKLPRGPFEHALRQGRGPRGEVEHVFSFHADHFPVTDAIRIISLHRGLFKWENRQALPAKRLLF